MPLYEYKCKECRQRLEKIQSFNAPPEKVCPKCGGELERVISAPAIQFKGAGWYVNDYAKSGARSKSGDGAENKAEGGAEKSETKSDGGAKPSTDSAAASTASSSSSSSGTESSGSTNADAAKPAAAK